MFGKSDLKTGIIVKTRNDSIWLVLKNSIFNDILLKLSGGINNVRKVNLCEFTEDLKRVSSNYFDITEVAAPSVFPDIFDPEDVKELTVGQLEEILGYKIKIVKGEEC